MRYTIPFNGLNTYSHLVREPRVVVGEHAFARCGLTTTWLPDIQLETTIPTLHGQGLSFIYYYHTNNADKTEFTKPLESNPNVLLPTRERAIVDFISIAQDFNEGILIEGLMTYLNENSDLTKLYECADIFGLPRETLDYWLNEARSETCE